jgi:AAA+ ATPase superfamily predicted ATPase
MNQHFVNRKEELKFLEKYYKKGESSLIIIYGRRRIGKTELIKNFIKSKNSVYYLCEREPIQKNVEKFKEIVAEKLGEEWLKRISVKDFEAVFKAIEKRLKKEKIVIVFDEFPYLIEMDRGIVSQFQKIWDEILKNTKTLLILCGSSVGMMETEVLGYKSPLYGRRSAQWKLTELEIKFLKDFLPLYDFESILYTYGI